VVEEEGLKNLLVKKMVDLEEDEVQKVLLEEVIAVVVVVEEKQTDQIDLKENLTETENLLADLEEDAENNNLQ
jgi:hypothetical protein